MHAIEISHLSKTFTGKKRSRVEALQDLSLTIERGDVFGFLGPNGAGKSTTIKALMGLLQPTAGNVKILGQSAASIQARCQVGFLPENPAFYDFLTAEEYLVFVGRSFAMSKAQIETETDRVLELLELNGARKRAIRGYSKGMVQRLGLAQVLLHDPEVYILDEPMSGLDPVGRALVKDIILDLKKRGKCVFFSTHITADVETVCDRVGIISKGMLLRVAEVQSLLREGISGYLVRVLDQGNVREVSIARDDLSRFIREAQARGVEISLIEPQRKHLEEFFLETIQKCPK